MELMLSPLSQQMIFYHDECVDNSKLVYRIPIHYCPIGNLKTNGRTNVVFCQ